MEGKTIYILSNSYPFGPEEKTFFRTEVQEIASRFERVILLPLGRSGEPDNLSSNVHVAELFKNYQYKRPAFNTHLIILLLHVFFLDFFRNGLKLKFYAGIKDNLSLFMQIFSKFKVFDQYISTSNEKEILLYSLWFDEWASIAAIYKRRYNKKKNIKFISRAHGFDVYDQRNPKGFIPFRKFQLREIDRLVLISKNGMNYMKTNFPGFKNKFSVSYLGTVNKYEISLEVQRFTGHINIVSCSSVIKLKRVSLIIEALKLITNNITWTHFGDGDQMQLLTEKAKTLPQNITVHLKGFADNVDVMKFYADNFLNAFVNVSESEGLPVSLMEAASFGIPLVATDVGGTSEIVNDITGILLRPDFSSNELAEAIRKINSEPYTTPAYRQAIKTFWQQNFESKKNSHWLIDSVLLENQLSATKN